MKKIHVDWLAIGDEVEVTPDFKGKVIRKTQTPVGFVITVRSAGGIETDIYPKG